MVSDGLQAWSVKNSASTNSEIGFDRFGLRRSREIFWKKIMFNDEKCNKVARKFYDRYRVYVPSSIPIYVNATLKGGVPTFIHNENKNLDKFTSLSKQNYLRYYTLYSCIIYIACC